MFALRSYLWLGVLAVLAACSQQPQVAQSTAVTLSVVEVSATTTVSRTNTSLPKSQIVETVRRKVESALQRGHGQGTRPVRVEVVVRQFYIANAGAGILLGGTASSISTEIQLVDVRTDEVIEAPFQVVGTTAARPTIFGAAAIKSPTQELAIITDSLARNVQIAVFGNSGPLTTRVPVGGHGVGTNAYREPAWHL